jgi:outer membrane protein assembly factor BamB
MRRRSEPVFLRAVLILTVVFGAAPASAVESTAQTIMRNAGARAGLCIHLGVQDGRLTAQLGKDSRFLVHGLAGDDASRNRAREHLHKLGLYGRVSVETGSFERLPYADNLANTVVVRNLPAMQAGGLKLQEVFRVLAPRGAARFGKTSTAKAESLLREAGIRGITVNSSDGWAVCRKPFPADMDEWTHHRHGPDGNAVSTDTVGVPNSLRWQAGPLYQVGRHYYGGGTPVSANGRLFIITREEEDGANGPIVRYVVWGRDGHNGLLLWRRPATEERSNLVAHGDRVYAVLEREGPLLALDAATGETLKSYDKAPHPNDWLLHKDTLIIRSTPVRGPGEVFGLDAATGSERWRKELKAEHMLVAGTRVFCLTLRDKEPEELVCLDAASGAQKWRSAEAAQLGMPFCWYDGVLIFGASARREAQVHGVSARDGTPLWSFKYRLISHGGRPSKVFGVDGLVWVNKDSPQKGWVGLDTKTGELKKFHKEGSPRWSRNLCADNRATKRFILTRTMLFVDVRTGAYHRPWGMKNACSRVSILPANGLIYTFPHQCICYPMLRGVLGLASEPPVLPGETHPSGTLERGPAYGFVGAEEPDGEAWRIYRADEDRSGATKSRVAAEATLLWETNLGAKVGGNAAASEQWRLEWARQGCGRVTAPTIADGKVFLAQTQRHRVMALDAKTGNKIWGYTVGGRVDTPPTIHAGFCLFGSNDGWVYCVKAEDGQLVWRFQAAPAERKVVVLGQLESTWPVHGSVLVHSDLAYFVAGRHSKVDSGIFLYAVEPATGKLRWSKRPKHYHGLAGLLVANGVRGVNFASQHYSTGSSYFKAATGRAFGHMVSDTGALSSNTGLLSEAWKGSFSYSRRFSRWSHRGLEAWRMVFDDKSVYGLRLGAGKKAASLVRWDRPSAGEGDPSKPAWTVELPKADRSMPPRHVLAMALTGNVLWVAGRIGREREAGHLLRAYAAGNGRQLREIQLPSPPVNDGIAAAQGRLYVSCTNGTLLCYGRSVGEY